MPGGCALAFTVICPAVGLVSLIAGNKEVGISFLILAGMNVVRFIGSVLVHKYGETDLAGTGGVRYSPTVKTYVNLPGISGALTTMDAGRY